MSNLHVDFSALLNELDSEIQTYGCRQNNPYICDSNGLEEICAFILCDDIWKKLSRAWKKQYNILKQLEWWQGGFESQSTFILKTDAPSHAYFREIAKGVLFFVGYLPERLDFKGYGEIFVHE